MCACVHILTFGVNAYITQRVFNQSTFLNSLDSNVFVFIQQVKVCKLWAVLCEFSAMAQLEPQKLKPVCKNRKTFFEYVVTRCLELENSPRP